MQHVLQESVLAPAEPSSMDLRLLPGLPVQHQDLHAFPDCVARAPGSAPLFLGKVPSARGHR